MKKVQFEIGCNCNGMRCFSFQFMYRFFSGLHSKLLSWNEGIGNKFCQ